jgi:MoxR-like ATPase
MSDPHSQAQRINQLLHALNQDVIEKKEAINFALLSALAGESIFFLGKPGVAKSLIARRIKFAFADSSAFEYLMNRFSTPDEIFGPVSISKLKDEDRYERLTADYLPSADVVFLDEIWKAGPAIQNALLTVLNEKKYRNGAQEINLPLKALLAASNELPAQGEGLEALWDRFLLRLVVESIKDKQNFEAMLCLDLQADKDHVPTSLKIKPDEYQQWQNELNKIHCPKEILDIIHDIRLSIALYNQTETDSKHDFEPIYVSDRRWRKIIRLLRTCALFNDRQAIEAIDCYIIPHCLWDEPAQLPNMTDIVQQAIEKHGYQSSILDLSSLKNELIKLEDTIKQATRVSTSQIYPKLFEGRYLELVGAQVPLRYILKHEFDNMLQGSSEQTWQLQAWQTYPRQSYAHGIIRAKKHPINPQTQFLEISQYGATHVHTILTEIRTIETIISPTAELVRSWDNIVGDMLLALHQAEQKTKLLETRQDSAQHVFLGNQSNDLLTKVIQKNLQQIRSFQLAIEKIQYQYKHS